MENQRLTQIIQKTLRWEGGYVNNPQDPGGETNYGISKRAYPDLDIKALTKEQAIAIYERDYWNGPGISKITNNALAGAVFDFGVTAGPKTAIKYLQMAANWLGARLDTDGIIGPRTLGLVNSYRHAQALFMAFKIEAGTHYMEIVLHNPSLQIFLAGWLNRLAEQD